MIGGEQGKRRPCWILLGYDIIFGMSAIKKLEAEVKRSKPEVKCQNGDFIDENLPDRVFYNVLFYFIYLAQKKGKSRARLECQGGRLGLS